jgi:hypothetical protein
MEITGLSAWQQLRRELEHSPRSQAWRNAGCWALDSAERHLGSNWLARHADSGRPVPGMFLHPGSDLEALSHLLELGLLLELLKDLDGYVAVRKMLRRDLDAQAWRHPVIQLEVASLAQRVGMRCCLEHSQGRPAHIVLGPAGSELVAEVKVVLLDSGAASSGSGDQLLGQALSKLAFLYGVDFDGQMTVRLGEEQLSQWLAQLEAAARSVARTGRPLSVTWGAEAVTVLPMGSAAGASFTGPVTHARGWERTSQLLRDKAEQLACHGGGWLRVDSLDGLFWASEWAHKPLDAPNARDRGAHLRCCPAPSLHPWGGAHQRSVPRTTHDQLLVADTGRHLRPGKAAPDGPRPRDVHRPARPWRIGRHSLLARSLRRRERLAGLGTESSRAPIRSADHGLNRRARTMIVGDKPPLYNELRSGQLQLRGQAVTHPGNRLRPVRRAHSRR